MCHHISPHAPLQINFISQETTEVTNKKSFDYYCCLCDEKKIKFRTSGKLKDNTHF